MIGRRQALAQRGGRITQAGDPGWSEPLASALAAADGGSTDDLTHGFHAYPARMHPVLVRELLQRFTEPGDVVLDPFAGSGSVLIEALVAGCRPQGVDLSPLANRVAEQQCALRDPASRQRFRAALGRVAAASEARVRGRAEVTVPISRSERVFYDPHVMLELSGLWDEIQKVTPAADRRALEIVFSALLVKFSRQRADTTEERAPRRIRKGLTTEFFGRKGHELALRWEALYEAAPAEPFPVRFQEGDVRRLPEVLGPRFRADLVLTSPPYGGTYDYADHHARRAAWLNLDMRALRSAEIGARRNLSTPRLPAASRGSAPEQTPDEAPEAPAERRERNPLARWDRELGTALEAMRNVLRKDGVIVLWLGDAELSKVRVAADEQVMRLAPGADLELVAGAAQERTDMRGGPPRREHLLALRGR